MEAKTFLARTSALAIAAALAFGPVAAQQQSGQRQGGQQQLGQQQLGQQQLGQRQGQRQARRDADRAAGAMARHGLHDDSVVASVGDAEIRGRDVLAAIDDFPAPLRRQMPELIIPMALDQLVIRRLMVEEARDQGLEEDEAVMDRAEPAIREARERALLQVWLEREMEDRVSDEDVRDTYDRLSEAALSDAMPPFEQVRDQIERHLRAEAFQSIRDDLMEDAETTFYGPSGEPLEAGADRRAMTQRQRDDQRRQAQRQTEEQTEERREDDAPTASVGRLSADEVRSLLEEGAWSDVTQVERDAFAWTAEATRDGDKVELRVEHLTAMGGGELDAGLVKAMLEAEGFRNVSEVSRDDDIWTASAERRSGPVKLYVYGDEALVVSEEGAEG